MSLKQAIFYPVYCYTTCIEPYLFSHKNLSLYVAKIWVLSKPIKQYVSIGTADTPFWKKKIHSPILVQSQLWPRNELTCCTMTHQDL